MFPRIEVKTDLIYVYIPSRGRHWNDELYKWLNAETPSWNGIMDIDQNFYRSVDGLLLVEYCMFMMFSEYTDAMKCYLRWSDGLGWNNHS